MLIIGAAIALKGPATIEAAESATFVVIEPIALPPFVALTSECAICAASTVSSRLPEPSATITCAP
jgi:hypothetical protein